MYILLNLNDQKSNCKLPQSITKIVGFFQVTKHIINNKCNNRNFPKLCNLDNTHYYIENCKRIPWGIRPYPPAGGSCINKLADSQTKKPRATFHNLIYITAICAWCRNDARSHIYYRMTPENYQFVYTTINLNHSVYYRLFDFRIIRLRKVRRARSSYFLFYLFVLLLLYVYLYNIQEYEWQSASKVYSVYIVKIFSNRATRSSL